MDAQIKKIMLIVLDGAGIGEAPDAAEYGDAGSNTLINTAKATGGFHVPNLYRLGLANIADFPFQKPADSPAGCYGKAMELSKGKDTTTGHWEIMGLITDKPFPVFPRGFPEAIISAFESGIGRKVLGNKPASGTAILDELGQRHRETGMPIVYTSADSVFQIAAHEDIVPVQELYRWCEIARRIVDPYHVERVIARPFTGGPGHFKRTERRKDFAVPPPGTTVLDILKAHGMDVAAIGKINDIFSGRGITHAIHSGSNEQGIKETINAYNQIKSGIVFTNLNDFDTLYGHRNDPVGFKNALEYFDTRLKDIMDVMDDKTLLLITADHGCDPTTASTDHSREYVPLLAYRRGLSGKSLGIRHGFCDTGKTILKAFSLDADTNGVDFIDFIFTNKL
ncbi:MAG: phosphopentomutase [Deltaproteobacteria bacterium]|nr:phosphopentomutase [Deltaproteobacteria bacterium]